MKSNLAKNQTSAKVSFMEKDHKNLVGILFLLPTVILMFIFKYLPILLGIFSSFFSVDIVNLPGEFVGLANYERAIHDPMIYKTLAINLKMAIWSICTGFWPPILLAVLINEVRGKKQAIYRMLFYIPSITPGIASTILWKYIWNPDYGLMNQLMGALGLPHQLWLNDPELVYQCMYLPSIVFTGGMTMIIYLSALQNVSQELYEAAVLDGAGVVKRVRYITIPTIKDTIGTMFILGMIGYFNAMEGPMVLTGGGPAGSTTPVLLYAYQQATNNMDYAYAITISTAIFFIVLILTAIVQHYTEEE